MSKVSEQTENRSCRSNVNKEHECEKVRKHECECEKNREQEQNERCEHEHKEKNLNVDIDDDDKELESCQSFLFMQLTSSVYSANSQHTVISGLYIVLQIT